MLFNKLRMSFILCASLMILGLSEANAQTTVNVRPGQNLGQLATAYPAGTIFRLAPGTYRQVRIIPKDNQQFIGQAGVILNGAMVLNRWAQSGGYYVHSNLPAPLYNPGFQGEEWHKWREDLFINNILYRRVFRLADVRAGTWYFDPSTRRAFLRDSPVGKTVELGVTDNAFDGYARNVVVSNMRITKYATRGQTGALNLMNTTGWQVLNVTANWNHGGGLRLGNNTLVRGGSYSDNGQIGISGGQGKIGGRNCLIDNVNVARNNYAGFAQWWEAGGIKIVYTGTVSVINSRIFQNRGQAIWYDWAMEGGGVIRNNHVYLNYGMGLQIEMSGKMWVRQNFFDRNARTGDDVWFWGSAILIQNGWDNLVEKNVVNVGNGDGIGLTYQRRSDDMNLAYKPYNNVIRDNFVYFLQPNGLKDPGISGANSDFDNPGLLQMRNTFDSNTYYTDTNRSTIRWRWGQHLINGNYWATRSGEFERNGRAYWVTNVRAYAPTTYAQAMARVR